ncbi:MAG: glycosyltransferase [Candidatus Thorarchaeota archaeon]
MNLLILTTTFPKSIEDYSTPRFVHDLSLSLAERGYNIIVLTPDRPNSKKMNEIVSDSYQIHRFRYFFKKKQFLTTGEGILPIIKKSKSTILLIPFLIFAQFLATLRIMKKYRIDIINSHWLVPSGLIGALIQKILGKKNYVTIHAAGLHLLERIPLGSVIARFIYNNSTRIFVVSNFGKKRLYRLLINPKRETFDKKVNVSPMGANIKIMEDEIEKKCFKENTFNVLFIGRIVEKKGLQFAINAFSKINDKDVYFHICGDGPLKEKLKQSVIDMNQAEKIVFYGKISEERKIKFLNSADILLVPSIETNEGDKEGLPVVILEALSTGLPIVATNVGGIEDGVINNYTGLLIEQKNEQEITKSILYLKNNPKLLKELSNNCKKYATNFEWKNIAYRYDTIIRESLKE